MLRSARALQVNIGITRAFERAYLSHAASKGNLQISSGREVPIAGFGIADLVWVRRNKNDIEAFAVSQTVILPHLVTAFEMKIADWQKGLSQAVRYRFFAYQSFLVLPAPLAENVRAFIPLFKASGVGLIAFNQVSGSIQILIRPYTVKPLSERAYKVLCDTISLFRESKVDAPSS